MQNLSSFLNKFKTLTSPKDSLRKIISDVIFELTKIPLTREEIDINQNIIFIKTTPIKKIEILLKKEFILNKVEQVLIKKTLTDIK
jgi:hypothetical protein